MNLSSLLNVAIGVILIYLILSLVASEIQEVLTTVLQWRAAHLKKSIKILLVGSDKTLDTEIKTLNDKIKTLNDKIKTLNANDKIERPNAQITELNNKIKEINTGIEPLNNKSKKTNTEIKLINDRIEIQNDKIEEIKKEIQERDDDIQLIKVKNIIEELYNNPLIINISQESKDGIEETLRSVSRLLIKLRRNPTLKGNEPSYIPSETFASTLLGRLNLYDISQKITAFKLQMMIEEDFFNPIRNYIQPENRQGLKKKFEALVIEIQINDKIEHVCKNLEDNKATLLTSINRIKDEIDSLINLIKNFDIETPDTKLTKFIEYLNSLKNGIFYQTEYKYRNRIYNNTDELIRRLQPRIVDILDGKQNKNNDENCEEINGEVKKIREKIDKEIKKIRNILPDLTQESLAALAKRAQINSRYAQVQSVEDEIYHFKTEIQVWFDRSMERASGVYKRNAKGIAFLIGFLLACTLNVDTFHIFSRLTVDSQLRDDLNKKAGLVKKDCFSAQGNTFGECVLQKVNSSISLPLGWDKANLKQQAQESESKGKQQAQESKSKGQFIVTPRMFFRMFFGWIFTGFAIMMGAPFWFELLGKIINVRNAGKPPETSPDRQGINQAVTSSRVEPR